jgi:hypothetical protein
LAAGDVNEAALAKSRRFSWMVLACAGAVLLAAAPLARNYDRRLIQIHGASWVATLALAGAVLLAGLAWALLRFPRQTTIAAAVAAVVQIAASGNLIAFLEAAALLTCVGLLGDLLTHLLRGEDPDAEDWPATLALGAAATSLLVLVLAEVGVLGPIVLAAAGGAVLAARWRRIKEYATRMRRGGRPKDEEAPRILRALWLALAVAALAVVWFRVLGPDLSWDALAYHLPEARDVARHDQVAIVPDLFPHSLLWRMHANFLALGFFAPHGDRVVQFLNFFFGLTAFGATALLARRVGAGASAPLVILALVGFPVILFQLHSSYADWPAAAFVAASAAEFAGSRGRPRRTWLGAVLFGAAVATKPYALCAAPALAMLFARRGHWRLGRIAAAILLSLAPVIPWMIWSSRHFGSFLAPVSAHSADTVESLPGGRLALVPAGSRPPSHPREEPSRPRRSLAGFLRLPYDLTFHSSRFQGFRDGYFGLLALLLAVGILGWGPVPLLLFALSAAAALVPWYLGPSPSIRYLFPIYPLYAMFTATGISRGTGRFSGKVGLAAGVALAAAVLAFPVPYDPKVREVKAAFGLLRREEVLTRELPSYSLWKHVEPKDRAILIGEYDRFHCPAELAYRTKYIPVRYWENDAERWRRELRRFGITVVVVSSGATDRASLVSALVDSGDLRLVAQNRGTSLYRVAPAADRPHPPGL